MGPMLAVLAALFFALGAVLQQRGTLQTEAPEGDPHFLAEIVRQRVWLAGALCQGLGWVLQAAALAHASLVVVQALCTLSLVFALPLGARLTDQVVGTRSVVGALLVLVGIVGFVAVGQPQDDGVPPEALAWWTSGLVCAIAVVMLAAIARRRGGAIAAALFATAAGLGFAYQAAVTKVFVDVLGDGLAGVLTSWTTYALIATALAGFALQQSALKTGYLAPAMAASNATTLVMSVILGGVIFDETIAKGEGRALPAVIGLAFAVAGVVLLASTGAAGREAATTPISPDVHDDTRDEPA